MKERYLFKAKRVDNGEWIEGLLTKMWGQYHIINPDDENVAYPIEEATICQCTGLRDKNDKLIWENDIVEFEDTGEEGYEYKEGFDYINRAMVEFAEGRWSLTEFASENSGVMEEMYDHAEFMGIWEYCKVIGNKIDNPELLEE